MNTPRIFRDQPTLTKAQAAEIAQHVSNARIPLRQWLATNPSLDDLKRAVLVEVVRASGQDRPLASLGRGVLGLLMKRIQQLEYSAVDAAIRESLTEHKS